MAEQKFNIKGGFFDSVNKDRTYTADDMNRPYKRIITEGIFATPAGTPSTDLQVLSANNGMNIIVKSGMGLLGSKWFENENDVTITVPANNNIVPRRDSVIIQVDVRTAGRICNVIYRTGTASSNSMPPDLSTLDTVIEKRVANIYVAAGATNINQDAITDLRGSSECPWITSLIKQVDTSTLYEQWNTAYQNYYDMETTRFNEFMRTLTEELTVNTNIIKLESHYITTLDGTTQIPINIADYNKSLDVLNVYINRLKAIPNVDYTISNDGTYITLTKDCKSNQSIDFLVLKSIVVGDNEHVIELVQALSTNVSSLNTDVTALKTDSGWINFTLENGTAFDDTTKPAIRKFGNQVFIRGAIKGLDTLNIPICTLPTNMRPAMNHQYPFTAFANGVIAANGVLEVRTTGSIYMIVKSGTIPATAMLPINTNFILG